MLTHCSGLGQGKVRPWTARPSTSPVTPAAYALACHPATPCPALTGIRVTVARDADSALLLRYTLAGDLAALRLPPLQSPGPADDLWQHTCCEAFVALAGDGYREFNLSPSGQWAIYDFAGYRQRAVARPPAAAPVIALPREEGAVALEARLPPDLLAAAGPSLGLTAVIETADGEKSYWALAHAPGNPDFHRRENFLATLPRV